MIVVVIAAASRPIQHRNTRFAESRNASRRRYMGIKNHGVPIKQGARPNRVQVQQSKGGAYFLSR
jgi:hypothetical protein